MKEEQKVDEWSPETLSYEYAAAFWLAMLTTGEPQHDDDLKRLIDNDEGQTGRPFYRLAMSGFLGRFKGDESMGNYTQAYNHYAIARNAFMAGYEAAQFVKDNKLKKRAQD